MPTTSAFNLIFRGLDLALQFRDLCNKTLPLILRKRYVSRAYFGALIRNSVSIGSKERIEWEVLTVLRILFSASFAAREALPVSSHVFGQRTPESEKFSSEPSQHSGSIIAKVYSNDSLNRNRVLTTYPVSDPRAPYPSWFMAFIPTPELGPFDKTASGSTWLICAIRTIAKIVVQSLVWYRYIRSVQASKNSFVLPGFEYRFVPFKNYAPSWNELVLSNTGDELDIRAGSTPKSCVFLSFIPMTVSAVTCVSSRLAGMIDKAMFRMIVLGTITLG
jgi:hypothetical protein